MAQPVANLAIALLHYPVYNKHREIVTTALTNLDLHDIARSSKSYGLDRFYIVTPSQEQRNFAKRIAGHWQQGWGADYNPDRKEALGIINICTTLKDAVAEYQTCFAKKVRTIITGASKRANSTGFQEMRTLLDETDQPFLLMLGTGWGLTEECFNTADYILDPITGPGTYNHLSVRSAAAIMLDRLRSNI
jgi:hypothetical protein